jgi:predicted DNA-binding transcriptional regulator AlpA
MASERISTPIISTSNRPFPSGGLVRLAEILAPAGPIPVGKSTWWAGVRSGRFPQPLKLGPHTTCWRAEDICALIAAGVR